MGICCKDLCFAVVIVTYNRVELLKMCVDALRKQKRAFDKIIVVDNASTDGTSDYLLHQNDIISVTMEKNVGGAGGFEKGVRVSMQYSCDWVTLIDDDAILDADYLYQIIQYKEKDEHVRAMCGAVYNNDKLTLPFARRIRIDNNKKRIYEWSVPASEYRKDFFNCNIASFCGLTICKELILKIGYPNGHFFICYDDSEYSMRIKPNEGIVVIPKAVIDHKAVYSGTGAVWKLYYSVRNDIVRMRIHFGLIYALIYSQKYIRRYNTYLKDIPSNNIKKNMIRTGIIDGIIGRLGKNKIYCPESCKPRNS